MSVNADSLPIEDVHPVEVPVSQPEKESVTPPVENTPEPVAAAPQDKAPQQSPPTHQIPKWRLDEVLEQNRELKARLSQHQPQQQPQQPQAEEPPKQEDFQSFEHWQIELGKYGARQELSRHHNQMQQAQQVQQFHERVRTADSNFEAKIFEAEAIDPTLRAALENAPRLRDDLQLMLKESDHPVALVKHLAANPAEVFRLNQMRPDLALREMVKAEMKLTAVPGGPSKMPSAKAPNLDPVGGGNTPAPKDPYSRDTSEIDYVTATRKLKRG